MADDAALWHTSTHYPFLEGVRDGTLAPAAFSRWLVPHCHFELALTAAPGRYLAQAPREDLAIAGYERGFWQMPFTGRDG